jgi:hypothetical protein
MKSCGIFTSVCEVFSNSRNVAEIDAGIPFDNPGRTGTYNLLTNNNLGGLSIIYPLLVRQKDNLA